MVEFVAQEETGLVGVGFHFQSMSNHYAVMIYPATANKCELVGNVYGNNRVDNANKDSHQKCGYTKDTKFAMKIHMNGTKILMMKTIRIMVKTLL